MTVSLIVAMAANGVIGHQNRLPWHLSADLRRFKQLTMGHHLLMGRKTFEAIGRPLPGRTTIVITRNREFHVDGVTSVPSLAAALELAAASGDEEIFVAGGGEIFLQALPVADRLHVTLIERDFEGDVHFPAVDTKHWKLDQSETGLHDDKSGLTYSYLTYNRV